LKASGTCATLKDAQSMGGKVAGKGRPGSDRSEPVGPDLKPTVIQAAASGLGITENAVKKRAQAAAKAAGMGPVSIERDSPERLREAGQAALERAHEKKRGATPSTAPAQMVSEKPAPCSSENIRINPNHPNFSE
jgi:hypothetical protein